VNARTKVLAAAGASFLLLGGALGAVVAFGYTSDPNYTSLQKKPDPSIAGTVAYVGLNESGDRSCLFVVAASGGEPREVSCDDVTGQFLAFTQDGKLIAADGRFGADQYERSYVVYDTVAAKEVERFTALGGPAFGHQPESELFTKATSFEYPDSEFFGSTSGSHTAWVARDEAGADRVLHRKAPGDYDFYWATYSPDKKWVLVIDSENDLLIGNEKNSIRKLVHSHSLDDEIDDLPFSGSIDFGWSGFTATLIAWYQPGQTTGTVTLDELRKPGEPLPVGPEQSFSYSDSIDLSPVALRQKENGSS
jgi:hypothetical protein